MLWAIVSILVLAIILFIVWRIVGLFIADQNIMSAFMPPGAFPPGHPILPPSR